MTTLRLKTGNHWAGPVYFRFRESDGGSPAGYIYCNPTEGTLKFKPAAGRMRDRKLVERELRRIWKQFAGADGIDAISNMVAGPISIGQMERFE